MSESILKVADDLWTGARGIEDTHPFSFMGDAEEVADGVAFVPSFANVSAISTDDGLVLVDTGSALFAQHVHDTLRRWTPARLHTAVFSHGHIDHVFGVAPFEAEAAERGWVPPPIARLLRLDGTPSDPATPRPPPPSSDEVSAAGAAYARALIEAVVAGDEAALASFASTDALADGLRKEFHDRTRSAWAPAAAALEREFGATSPAPLDAAKAERIRSWFRRLHAGMKGGLR